MPLLVFVSHDFELGRTWLVGGVDRQSRTGLIFTWIPFVPSLTLKFLTSSLDEWVNVVM